MIERLVDALDGVEPAPSAEELADALWLARFLDPPGGGRPEGGNGAGPRTADASGTGPGAAEFTPGNGTASGDAAHGEGPSGSTNGRAQAAAPAKTGAGIGAELGTVAGAGNGAVPGEPAASVRQAGLYLPGSLPGGDAKVSFPVRSPTLPALPRTLKLARALRPLRLDVPAPGPGRLNAKRTVRRFAETGVWAPQLDPVPERRFALVLVVDVAASMTVWRHTADELRLLLERLGAFRDVRIRYLDTDADTDGLRLGTDSAGAEGRRIVLVVSDCIGAAWQDGRAAALLERWGRSGAVAIVQPLPQRLWRRCAAATEQVYLRASAPGAANARLAVRARERGAAVPPGVAVPVLELDRRWLAPWAAMVAGSGREIAGEALFTGRPVAERPAPSQAAQEGEPTALERVLRFRASASPQAFELAGYLAAAPLRLPVMRLVQRAMLPRSTPAHFAEVFLGGLMRVADGDARDPSAVAYEFHDGVRDVLLGGLRRNEALTVLREVWGTVRDRLGSSLDFPALLAAVQDDAAVLPPDQPFAQVAARVLARLGGSYGEVARRLTAAAGEGTPVPAGGPGDDRPDEKPAERGVPSLFAGVPPRDPGFHGRDDLIPRVAGALRDAGTVVLLPGTDGAPGGEGKTRLAVESTHARLRDYDLVWWIPAADTRSVRASLGALAHRLGTPSSDDLGVTVGNLLRALRGGLPGGGRWLLVYDDACDPADVLPLMPRGTGGGTGDVLVTSRDRRWARVAAAVEVGAFARSRSVSFLRRRVPWLPADAAERVAERCGDLPGALAQAAAWLTSTGDTDYAGLLDERIHADQADPYAAALGLTLERLDLADPAAADLLRLWSYLGSEPVPAGLLAGVTADETAVLSAMRALDRSEVARFDPDARTLQVSPSVRTVLRDRLPAAEQARMRDRVHAILIAATPELVTPHLLPSGLIDADGPDAAREVVADQLRLLLRSGDHETCRALAAEAVARWRARHGDFDALMHDAARALTDALEALGRPAEAAEIAADIVRGMGAQLGRAHPATVLAAGRLGAGGPMLRLRGDFKGAYERDEDFWRRVEQRYGRDHPETLHAAAAVAADLCLLGRFHEAHAIDAAGPERPRDGDRAALDVAYRLARDLHGLGRYDEAVRAQEAAIARAPALLGRDHALVLRAQAVHAGALRKAGRLTDAARLATLSLDGHLRRFGAEHPGAQAAKVTAALARAAAGSPGPGRVLAEEALASYRRTLGEDHPFTSACAIDLGILLRVVGDVQTALDTDRAALEALRRDGSMGPDHYYALCGAAGMAKDLYLLGELGAALDLAEHARDGFRARHGPRHPYTLACAHNVATIRRAAGLPGGAADPGALAGLLGEHHPEVRAAARGDLLDCDIALPPL
ncbi:FxSxx-COOH system tetratricopeptide repeat protein [Actinomadura vinacea]|uniref:FxSxx-COOH system tetratricopeptide repeat protein n=1 Tax=Actinomadura vinacea TaxID=115336 RepID=A0ABN3I9W4_9ACTN